MAKRLTVENWQCQNSGDCCRVPKRVTMTYAERRVLEAHAAKASRPLQWRYNSGVRFTDLVAGPCPFVTAENRCGVYEDRPFNCRRFGCMRPDAKTETFHDSPAGCLNLIERLPDVLQQLEAMQAAAQPWALAHGWDETCKG